jgi:amino acid adenylation domain-containing protein
VPLRTDGVATEREEGHGAPRGECSRELRNTPYGRGAFGLILSLTWQWASGAASGGWRDALSLTVTGVVRNEVGGREREMTMTSGPDTAALSVVVDVRDLLDARPLNRFAIAVDAPDATLTYGDLYSQVETLASVLKLRGIGPGDRVALCAPRSAAMVVGALGIVASGAAYVALDPAHPPLRLAQLIERAGTVHVVTSTARPVELPAELTQVSIDAATGECICAAAPVPGVSVGAPERSPLDPAYVVFTSGSTGVPKGVVVSHAGLSNLVAWHRRAFTLAKGDRSTLIASPAFDASVWEIWPTMASGGSLHVPTDDLRTDPAGLRDWLIEKSITVTFVPTAVTEQLLTLNWPRRSPLRVLLTGGDVLHRRPAQDLPFDVVNNYGVSEASVVSTSGVVGPPADGDPSGAPPIGTAIDGVSLAVVDESLCPVAAGEPGELLIGGDSVALGYLDEPELTARAFVEASIDGAALVRWYRTGDLVRRLPDGAYEHLGRIDEQVQVRGSRVELAEVAAALDQHPSVRASVVALRGAGVHQRLVAYVVGTVAAPDAADSELDRQTLSEFVANQLPEHMVPGAIVVLAALPLTSNGKVDRAALPDPEPADRVTRAWAMAGVNDDPQGAGAAELVEADPAVLEVVAGLICELLDLPSVDHRDNFFLLGGHSMLGAQLIARLDDLFAVELPLREVFQHPTVAGIAAQVEQAMVAELEVLSDEDAERLANALPGA